MELRSHTIWSHRLNIEGFISKGQSELSFLRKYFLNCHVEGHFRPKNDDRDQWSKPSSDPLWWGFSDACVQDFLLQSLRFMTRFRTVFCNLKFHHFYVILNSAEVAVGAAAESQQRLISPPSSVGALRLPQHGGLGSTSCSDKERGDWSLSLWGKLSDRDFHLFLLIKRFSWQICALPRSVYHLVNLKLKQAQNESRCVRGSCWVSCFTQPVTCQNLLRKWIPESWSCV